MQIMKRIALILISSVFLLPVSAQWNGELHTTITDKMTTQTMDVVWTLSADKLKIHIPYNGGEYMDIILNPSANLVSTYISSEAGQYFEGPLTPSQNVQSVQALNTGETKDIDGKTCNKIVAKVGGQTVEGWVYPVLFDFGRFQPAMADFALLTAMKQLGITGIPLEMATYDAMGNQLNGWESTKLESRAIGESDFSVPAGAEKVEFSGKK